MSVMLEIDVSNVKNTDTFSEHKALNCTSKVIPAGKRSTHLSVETLPEVLGHQTEHREEGPAKMVKTCITKVRIVPNLLTGVVFWTLITNHKTNVKQHLCGDSIEPESIQYTATNKDLFSSSEMRFHYSLKYSCQKG